MYIVFYAKMIICRPLRSFHRKLNVRHTPADHSPAAGI